MRVTDNKPLYQHTGVALLRAAVAPLTTAPNDWPDPADPNGCRAWQDHVWSDPYLAGAVRQASPSLGEAFDDIRSGRTTGDKQVRSVTLSTVRYLLRSIGRPTPFGLFAGVAPAGLGPRTQVEWGTKHHVTTRVNTEWLADIINRAEGCPDLLERLSVTVNDLAVRRGSRLEVPQGPNRVAIRFTRAVAAVQAKAATPVRFGSLVDDLAEKFGSDRKRVRDTLTEMVRHGYLITSLRARSTVTDPFTHVLDQLHDADAATLRETVALLADLDALHSDLRRHNDMTATRTNQNQARTEITARMRKLSSAGRTPLVVDLLLDCRVSVPRRVVHEMERAANVLLRLTRYPAGEPVWLNYQRAFVDRYGTGTLVSVTDLLDPDAGLGYPATYRSSVLPAPPSTVSERDERLMTLAWEAMANGTREIVLTDELVSGLTGEAFDPRFIPPHVELSARIHAASRKALDAGEFRLTVAPARSAGTLTSRFTPMATGSGLAQAYRALPAATEGALRAQMSFGPLYPHAENICRVPAYLDHILPLGEHREPSDEKTLIPVDDLAVTATRDRLYLVSRSRRQVVEPQVFHALALDKQPPPLARFLAHLPRAFSAAWYQFDWGTHHGLPFLPQVRYGRTVLSPAQWCLTTTDLPTNAEQWPAVLDHWRRRWDCPETVELRDADRTLRLSLDQPGHTVLLHTHLVRHRQAVLSQAAPVEEYGWINGHTHEIAFPLITTRPPAPNPLRGSLPVVTNSHGHLPGAPESPWLSAKLFTHPERINEIVAERLPDLLTSLNDPDCWWLRYHSPYETDHLILRIATASGHYGTCAKIVGEWAQRMRDAGLLGRLVLDTYAPEIGRYGDGLTLEAAETVFAADSAVVAAFLRHQPTAEVDLALVVANMVGIVTAFFGDHAEAMTWLVERPVPMAPSFDRAVTDRAIQMATDPAALAQVPGWDSRINAAWQHRAVSLAAHRKALTPEVNIAVVLESLLHMHHNRAIGIDAEHERICRRLARQAACSWTARHPAGD
ncbi:MAG: lantibiotic biosynthesis protein [Actinomycetota bacterium]|nr:lantibiotic biosynthesis protein [Actinomycetota bacterium]